jgi:hypothetical protein
VGSRESESGLSKVRTTLLALFNKSLEYVIDSGAASYSVITLIPHLRISHAKLKLLRCWLKLKQPKSTKVLRHELLAELPQGVQVDERVSTRFSRAASKLSWCFNV